MPAMAAPAAPPAGFEVVTPSTPQAPVVRGKDREPAQVAVSQETSGAVGVPADSNSQAGAVPVEPASTPAPVESGTQITEPTKLQRAQEAAKIARAGAAKNKALREQHSKLEQAHQYQQGQAANLQARLEQNERILSAIQADPLGALKQLGIGPDAVAKRMAAEGSPEAMIAETRALIQNQQREIEALKQEKLAAVERTRVETIENEYKQEAQNSKKYPNLSAVHPEFVLAATQKLVSDLRARGQDPRQWSNHDFLSYLDTTYAKPAAPKVAAVEASEPAAPASPAAAPKKTGTITNKLQSSRQALPADFAKMSDRAQRKAMADQFRQAGIAK